jgi:exosortase/archaeosortase family protein
MKTKIKQFISILKPYKEIIFFLFLLFFFHFSWKIAIDGDMDSEYIYLFGKDITPEWFNSACRWLTSAAAWVVRLFPHTEDFVQEPTLMSFTSNNGWKISIIWGCTGIKQMFIFTGIMLFYWGPFLKKLWYIPMGWVILTAYNVVRIATTVLLTKHHPERFESLHDGILRYIYYGIVFMLWVVWNEVIFSKNKKLWEDFMQIFKR